MDKLQSVAKAHRGNLRILVEETDHLRILVPLHVLLGLQELPDAESLPRCPIDVHGRRRLDGEAHVVEVNDVQLHGGNRACDDNAVDQTALGRDRGRADVDDRFCDQNADAVYFGGPLDGLCYADVRRQVGGINLELAPHRALDRPAVVQAAAEVHAAILAEALLQAWVSAVAREHRRAVHRPEDPCEGQHGHVCELAQLGSIHDCCRAPNHEEKIAIVLARISMELVDDSMHDFCDLVDEGHDFGLEHLRGRAKIADTCSTDDTLHPNAFNHRVDARTVHSIHVVFDDGRACLAETQRQQRT
mmetsp:Transcript_166903/g.535761  ORF Transcript_166903/g.535761 Transcript_166903/m.535761 type:complete len:303 (+) Transcript_166903:263-1171(+)